MSERIQLSEWDDVVDELRRFGDAGDVTVDDDGIRLDFGSAHVDISRDGAVSTGMPLHSFELGGDAALVVDHDAGSLTVEAEQLRYTFRRPDT